MKNRKKATSTKRRTWTEVFDDEANRFGKPFSKEEITDALLNNPDWRKDARARSCSGCFYKAKMQKIHNIAEFFYTGTKIAAKQTSFLSRKNACYRCLNHQPNSLA